MTNDTDDFVEGTKEQLVLFVIHNDITFEHYIDHIYDTQRIIQNIKDFTIELMGEYINVKYYSMTFRLNPVGDNIKLIISLQERITTLEKKLSEIPKQITMQKKPPEYLPPNLSLLCEVEYLRWDTLEDLFYMYPLNKKFHGFSNDGYGYYKLEITKNQSDRLAHEIFRPGHTHEFKINFETFNPNDIDLDDYIKANSHLNFKELSRSCKSPFIQNKKINTHILNWITEIFLYYILCWINQKNKLPSANIFINQYVCKMQILEQQIPSCQIKFMADPHRVELTKFKFRINFYIDDWTEPPVVVYV